MSDDESSGGEKEEQQAVEMRDLKKLSACVGCRLIKSDPAWKENGCENCGEVRETVKHFEGMIFLTKPRDSWVGKWNKLVSLVPGCYCIRITGEKNVSDGEEEDED